MIKRKCSPRKLSLRDLAPESAPHTHSQPRTNVEAETVVSLCKREENLILGFNFHLDVNIELQTDGLERRRVDVSPVVPPVPELLQLPFLIKDGALAKVQAQPEAEKAKLKCGRRVCVCVCWISRGGEDAGSSKHPSP